MFKKFKQTSITFYLIGIVLLSTLLVAFFLILSYYQTFESTLLSSAITSAEQSVKQVTNTINNYSTDILSKMSKVSEVISQKQNQEEIIDYMSTMKNLNNDIASIVIYSTTGEVLDYVSDTPMKEYVTNNLSFPGDLAKRGNDFITNTHVLNLFEGSYPWVITIGKKQWAGSYNQDIYITMDIQFSSMALYIDEVGIGDHGYCFIIGSDQTLVYHPLQQLINLDIKSEDLNKLSHTNIGTFIDQGGIYSIQEISEFNWKVVGVSFVSELVDSKVTQAFYKIVVLLVGILTVTVVIAYMVSHSLTSPMRQLVIAMKEFEKNAIDFKYKSRDSVKEVNDLSQSFEHMVLRIQELMDKVKNEEITLRKTELKALQAQINPHFLYNTLDSIQWMCEQNKNEDAVHMVGALAQLFRISISKGYELIPIEREVMHAKNYLVIQSYRYKDQFFYEFNIEEEALGYYCNKITLQPLIENALYHGISRMVDQGEILIKIYLDGNDVIFEVKDNGVGMTQEQVDNILKKELTDSKGIGVKNVNDRIKIYFGDEYGITVMSELDEGTTIKIKIPKVGGSEYEN